MKLIDKDALVAEIERLKSAAETMLTGKTDLSYWKAQKCLCERFLSIINTLEVKDVDTEQLNKLLNWWKEVTSDYSAYKVKGVDLEHEVESYWKQCDMTWCRDAYSMTHIRSMLSDVAKHFFELSIKAQKGE